MNLTLYEFAHSPYCIPITRALEALGIPFERVAVNPGTKEEVIRASDGTYYQVPYLIHDEHHVGESTPDSLDVARYVDETFASGRLFPARWDGAHLPLIAFVEGELELAGFKLLDPFYIDQLDDPLTRMLLIRHKERRFGAGCVEDWRRRHAELSDRFFAKLKPFETTFGRQPFLFGEEPIYADFALHGILGNVTFGGWNSLPESLPRLREWHERIGEFRFAGA